MFDVLDCPAERMTFELDDTLLRRGLSTTPGACDLWMRCADCGTWSALRYHPGDFQDAADLADYFRALAKGVGERHTRQFEAYVRGVVRADALS